MGISIELIRTYVRDRGHWAREKQVDQSWDRGDTIEDLREKGGNYGQNATARAYKGR